MTAASNGREAIAVVIPTWSCAATIDRCLVSIFDQCRDIDVEVVLVDDRSPDAGRLRELAARDPRITLIEKTERTNAAHSRSIGLAATRAPIVFFLDADDRFEAGHVRRRLDMFAHEACSVIFGRFRLDAGDAISEPVLAAYDGQDMQAYIFMLGGDVRSSTLSVDRRRLRGADFDRRLAKHQDWGFALAAQQAGEAICFDPAPGVAIDISRGGRMSARNDVEASARFLDLYLTSPEARRAFLIGRIKAGVKLRDRAALARFHTLLRSEPFDPRSRLTAHMLRAMAAGRVLPVLQAARKTLRRRR